MGALTENESDLLRTKHTFALGAQRFRENQVCLSLSERILIEDAYGALPLLSIWGGEGIYMGTPAVGHLPLPEGWPDLKRIGRPAIVVAAIDLAVPWRERPTFSDLRNVFVGIELDLKRVGADVFHRAPVRPEDILDIWQPGRVEYDRFSELPR